MSSYRGMNVGLLALGNLHIMCQTFANMGPLTWPTTGSLESLSGGSRLR